MISPGWKKVTGYWQLGQVLCKSEPSVERSYLHARTLRRERDFDRGHAMRQELEKIPG